MYIISKSVRQHVDNEIQLVKVIFESINVQLCKIFNHIAQIMGKMKLIRRL